MRKLLPVLIIIFVFFYKTPIASADSYYPINIGPIANLSLHDDYKDFPLGEVVFNNIPFEIPIQGNNFVATKNLACLSCPFDLYLSTVPIVHTKKIYLLVNSSDTFYPLYSNKNFASILLYFDDQSSYKYDFITGNNVREWLQSGNYGQTVNTVSSNYSQEVWRGYRPNGEYPTLADLLEIPIPLEFQNSTLTKIRIIDDSVARINSEEPGLIVKGITAYAESIIPTMFTLSTDWDNAERQVPIDRTAKIAVKVTDNLGQPVSGVAVSADIQNIGSGSLNQSSTTTIENGEAYFEFTPQLIGDPKLRFTVNSLSQEIVLNVYRPPIVIVPGAGASFNPARFFKNIAVDGALWNWSPTARNGWDTIITMLESNSYIYDYNYTIAFYDWRVSLDRNRRGVSDSVTKYLQPAINRVLSGRPAGQKVNILAHSYGGLVSRALIQQGSGQNVSRLVTLASPHHGSSNIYWIWEGGTMPPVGDPGFRVVTDSILKIYKHKYLIGDLNSLHQQFSGFSDLLPIYDNYVQRPGYIVPTNLLYYQNPVLTSRVSTSRLSQDLADRNIAFTSFYSLGESSLRNVSVDLSPGSFDWLDGKPRSQQSYIDGDNSVIEESARIGSLPAIELHGDHGEVPDLAAPSIALLLKINREDFSGTRVPKNMLGAVMLSPATVQIVSPAGAVLGESTEWHDTDGTKFAYAADIDSGVYSLRVTGTGDGPYTLYVPFAGEQTFWSAEYSGDIALGQVHNHLLFVDTRSGKEGSTIVETDMKIRLGTLNAVKRQLPLALSFDIPHTFAVDQLNLDSIMVNSTFIPVLNSRIDKRGRTLTLEVNAALVGRSINWDERETTLSIVVPGSDVSLFGRKEFRIPWGLYKKYMY